MDLTDQQWTIIEPLFEEKRRPDGRGRPWRDARAVTARSAIHGSLLDGGRL
jgi:transposase